MSWFRKGSKEEDEVYAEAADTLIEGVCDADLVNKADLHNGRNMRDQITTEQVEDLHRERTLRRTPNRN